MTRDYSQFLKSTSEDTRKSAPPSRLKTLGWSSYFAQQTDVDELARTPPVRVTEVHRNGARVIGEQIDAMIPPGLAATVGDWLLFNEEAPGDSTVLERKSLIKRRAPGSDLQVQLIAANIDTAFIVTSCNQDFNVARLERYIALAFEAEATPVILLTKSDLCEDAQTYVAEAQTISDAVPVVTLNARTGEALDKLANWCAPGMTIAFLGSSGVGKSTLANSLCQTQDIATREIREDDAKGRHTTTRRQLHFAPGGFAVLDTPGMRELQLTDAAAGVDELFFDLAALAGRCKFNDCKHQSEPGCAVTRALEDGTIEPARVERWKKLMAEEAFNSSTMAQRREKDRAFGKVIRQVQNRKQWDDRD